MTGEKTPEELEKIAQIALNDTEVGDSALDIDVDVVRLAEILAKRKSMANMEIPDARHYHELVAWYEVAKEATKKYEEKNSQ